jgi:thiamine pyrophosphate-dependent acetolactate synthase large subunit-like protein
VTGDLIETPAAVARVAATFGPPAFFGLSGSGNFHLTHELRDAGLTYYAATHEAACVAMADGYARTTGAVGVATVHQGPGFTNTLTALREAVRSHSPLVLFAAAVPATQSHHNQFVDQAALACAIGAVVETVSHSEAPADTVARAFRRAQSERTPIVTLLPLDVQQSDVTDRLIDPRLRQLPTPPNPQADAITSAAELIARADRPLILAGRGAVRADAGPAIARLGEQIAAPLLTSTQANGIFGSNPLSHGVAGGFGSRSARQALAASDLVIVFGCSLNPWTMAGNADLSDHAALIHIDTDPRALDGRIPSQLSVVADCAASAEALLARLSTRPEPERTSWWQETTPDDRAEPTGRPGRIDPRTLTRVLDDLLPEQRAVSIDSGHFMLFPASMLHPPDPAGFVLAQGFMSMGLALAEGLGAMAARPHIPMMIAMGDGGAKMSLCEIDTAVRHELPVLVVIYNDAAFGAEVHDFAGSGRPLDTVRFRDVDFAAVARGIGADGVTVRGSADLGAV